MLVAENQHVINRAELGGARNKATNETLLKSLELIFLFHIENSLCIRMSYLPGVLTGTKSLILKADFCPAYGYDRYSEFFIENMLVFAHEYIPDLGRYLPDDVTLATIDRHYFMDIINTLSLQSIENLRIASINRAKC